MLPTFWRNQYQFLLGILNKLQNLLSYSSIEPDLLQNEWNQLKDHFYKRVVPLKTDDIDLDYIGRWQSLQTELYRMMRLLETDMLFLQSSRNQVTRQARLKMISDRLVSMNHFCQEILKID